MKKQTKIILGTISFGFLLIFLLGYQLHWFGGKTDAQLADTIGTDSLQQAATVGQPIATPVNSIEPEKKFEMIDFPVSGNEIEDFVPETYKIAIETKGLLDADNLEDAVLVLQHKTDSTAKRPTLVLLKAPSGGYRLYATSWEAIGAAYINGDFPQYDSEDISIDENRILVMSTYSVGPVGNRDTKYRFVNNELELVYMETYNQGAGGQTRVEYDILNHKITVEEVNTMKEDMPTTVTHDKLPLNKHYLFKEIDPVTVFSE